VACVRDAIRCRSNDFSVIFVVFDRVDCGGLSHPRKVFMEWSLTGWC